MTEGTAFVFHSHSFASFSQSESKMIFCVSARSAVFDEDAMWPALAQGNDGHLFAINNDVSRRASLGDEPTAFVEAARFAARADGDDPGFNAELDAAFGKTREIVIKIFPDIRRRIHAIYFLRFVLHRAQYVFKDKFRSRMARVDFYDWRFMLCLVEHCKVGQ